MTIDRDKGGPRARGEAAVRASVSFPPELYRLLEQIALQKKVSIAWVVRDAAERYVSDQSPILKQKNLS
ncbi:ribbon-helix-helix protein, CopG family [Ralstonia pickettii]|nr:ribbon-helix-helix protein, CopG family [Ralstonia pickettii]